VDGFTMCHCNLSTAFVVDLDRIAVVVFGSAHSLGSVEAKFFKSRF
jgi:hypothetical protein